MANKIEITVVTPAYKCSECIEELYKRLVIALEKITGSFEIIFVNDASPDNDWNVIKKISENDKRVKGINLSRNFGQHQAISAGLDLSKSNWVVVMDCDLQDQPEEIVKLFAKAQEGFDVVFGRRSIRQDNFIRKVFSKLFSKLFMYFTETDLDNSVANFGIYSERVIENYKSLNEQNKNFPLCIKWLGYPTTYADVNHSRRFAGKSSYNFNKLFNLAIDSIISQSNKPLRLSIKIGFSMSFLAMIYGLYLIGRHYFVNIKVQGWTSMMVSLFFIAGLLLANMGLLGLYIGKIFDETKKRPRYIVKEHINK